MILLLSMWLTNVVLLFGAELNAAVDLRRGPELPATYDGSSRPARDPAEA